MTKVLNDSAQTTIYPVILAGGSGTRLWPLSRKSFPKQFSPITEGRSLYQETIARHQESSGSFCFAKPISITNTQFRFIITEQLTSMGVDSGAILIEPTGRNTAPAVIAAALHIAKIQPDAVMLVAPSDHSIPDTAAFHHAIQQGLFGVEQGDLVTFGINPTRPETGYGYLEVAALNTINDLPIKLDKFAEKPNVEAATAMVSSGRYLWNAGIFLFAVKDIITAYEEHAPDMLEKVQDSLNEATEDLGFLRLGETAWNSCENVSIDYAIMEKSSNISVVKFAGGWSDLGDWDAIRKHLPADSNGVVTTGNVTAIDCSDSLLRSENDGVELVGIGLQNIIAIAMNDAVLITDKSRSQDVKLAVDTLKSKGAAQAEAFAKDHRPWGWYESLLLGDRFQVKKITVLPGASLSLQSHYHRSEHWIVVEGTARVTVNDDVSLLSENQSVYIPVGSRHRMENPGIIPLVFIEVQTGSYVGEDDIVRYEDKYARN